MRTIVIASITFYQRYLSPLLHQLIGSQAICRFSPTCSEYAKQVITEYGIGKGLLLALKRLASCQPFGKVVA